MRVPKSQGATLSSLLNTRRIEAYYSALADRDHERFCGMCEAYAFAHRTAFLQVFLNHFVATADRDELKNLAEAASFRRVSLHADKKRGRPKASEDRKLLEKAVEIALLKYRDRLNWKAIAEKMNLQAASADQLKSHKTTMKRQLAVLAEAIFSNRNSDFDLQIKTILESLYFQRLLQVQTGMPFDRNPIACEVVLYGLAIDKLSRISRGGD